MDGSFAQLRFPVADPPVPGETVAMAPGVLWLRMPLPFALDHINLWLLADGDGWTIVDTGYAMPESRALWERIFAERLGGRPVTRVIVTITILTISGSLAGCASVGGRDCGPPKRSGFMPG